MAYDFNKLRNPVIRDLAEEIFSTVDGHDHDGVNSKTVAAGGTVAAGTPTNAAAASIVMTINGVAIDGETVTIGDDVYEFCADEESTVADGNIAVDIEDDTEKGSVTLTIDTVPTLGNTFTLGTKEFIVVATENADGDGNVAIGEDLPAFKENVVKAINGTDEYNDPHPSVTCADFEGDNAVITAIVGGTAGNLIASTSTFSAGTNKFSSATLEGGTDCSKADAKTALIAAIEGNEASVVGAEATAGDTLTITAKATGTEGNVDIGETMANGAFAGGAIKLAGGTEGTPGTNGDMMCDATYLYVCIADNTVTGANWRRVQLG